MAFLLDRGVRAKAGTLSDTYTDDGEAAAGGGVCITSQLISWRGVYHTVPQNWTLI